MQGAIPGDCASANTYNVKIGAVNPAMSFYVYNLGGGVDEFGNPVAGDGNTVEVSVRERGTTEWKQEFKSTVSEISGDVIGWHRVIIKLDKYAGKVLQFKIHGVIYNYSVVIIDNMKIGRMYNNDLAVARFVAPYGAYAGNKYNVQATIANEGVNDANAAFVKLFSGENEVASKSVDVKAGARANVDFEFEMSPLASEAINYHASIVYAADELAANNASDTLAVVPRASSLPVATGLIAKADGAGVNLEWTAPDIAGAPLDELVNESFESGESWADEFEDWEFIDQDGGAIGGMEGLNIPGHPTESTASFWIQDAGSGILDGGFAAHSGDKYLASMFLYDDSRVSDWAISPRLSGKAQTISFYARSYDARYAEVISVYYSKEEEAPSNFVTTSVNKARVPEEWTLYTVELPEGANYFAVHSNAISSFMLMLDDFTFMRQASVVGNELVGYDVYRSGVKANSATVADTKFVDAQGKAGDTYRVVAVYERGVSAASEEVSATTGVENVGVDNVPAEYFNIQGMRINEPVEGQFYIRRQGGTAIKVHK